MILYIEHNVGGEGVNECVVALRVGDEDTQAEGVS